MTDALEPRREEALAAELTLGLLDGAERAEAETLRRTDPGFAREVEAWDARLAAFTEGVSAVEPPASVWRRLERRLGPPMAGGAEGAVVVQLRRRLAVWRGAAAAAAGLAACLALALMWPRPAPPAPAPTPVLTARLSASAAGPAVFVAFYDPGRRAIVLTPATVHAAAGRSPELWLIPTGGKPIPLGVADFADSVQLVSAEKSRSLASGALAVSVEPRGGSPTGQPTGPVIATGQLSRLCALPPESSGPGHRQLDDIGAGVAEGRLAVGQVTAPEPLEAPVGALGAHG